MADFWSHSAFASSYFKLLLVGPNLKILKQLFCLWFTSETFLFLLEEKEKEKQVYRCKVDSCSCVSETDPPWECVEIIEDVRSLGAHLQVSFHWSSRSASQVGHDASSYFKTSFPFNLCFIVFTFHVSASFLFEEFDVNIVSTWHYQGFWGLVVLYRLLNRSWILHIPCAKSWIVSPCAFADGFGWIRYLLKSYLFVIILFSLVSLLLIGLFLDSTFSFQHKQLFVICRSALFHSLFWGLLFLK